MFEVNYRGEMPPHIKSIAEKNNIRFVENSEELFITYSEKTLSFLTKSMSEKKEKPISFDFLKLINYHQKKNYQLVKDPFAKALGKNELKKARVIDLTCGTGQDSILMYAFGVKSINAFEINPIIYLLLYDAYLRAGLDKINEFNIIFGDYFESSINKQIEADIIYFDPMYEDQGKRKALPRKEMRIFHEVLNNNITLQNDPFSLLEKQKFKRLIIKRTIKGKHYQEMKPDIIYSGKSTRYDVYLKK